jgi:N-acetyl-gamma-glutamyl-phosphate reductase
LTQKSVGILGATGYTGSELLKILLRHPGVSVEWLTSEKFAGQKISDVFPGLGGFCELECRSVSSFKNLPEVELVFSCLPHGTAMHFTGRLLGRGIRVIDFSADFRFRDAALYESLYNAKHRLPQYIGDAVYGIPEIFRDDIRGARLVANPGCYATGVILGTLPLLREGLIDETSIIADAKSGESGAGRAPSLEHHFPESNENARLNPGAASHQGPEMEEALFSASGRKAGVTFVPHNIPVNRGILTTIYTRLKSETNTGDILKIFKDFYKAEPFVRVCSEGKLPDIKATKYTNLCSIGVMINRDVAVTVVSLDNLVKGASGQAVQNMNLMLGFPETEGLGLQGMFP